MSTITASPQLNATLIPSTNSKEQGTVLTSLIVCSSIAVGLVLLILIAVQLTRRFGIARSKETDSIDQTSNRSLSRQWQTFVVPEETFGLSPCEFLVEPVSLVAVRSQVEVAFPALGTSAVRTSAPLPLQQASCYFETEVLSSDFLSNICIGLATESLSSISMPGHVINSVGFSSKHGQLYCNGNLTNYSSDFRFSTRDVVGCGYFPQAQMVLFTKNGRRVAYLPFNFISDNESLYPTIASSGPSTIKCNFGQKRFVLREANQNAWGFGVYSEIEVYDLPAPPPAYQPSNSADTNTATPNSLTINTVTRRTSCTPRSIDSTT